MQKMRSLVLQRVLTKARRQTMTSKASVENVKDYPRPPAIEKTSKHLKVMLGDVSIADSTNAYRVLETYHPPTYYIPPEDVRMDLIQRSSGGRTTCEWKGQATYFDVIPKNGKEPVQRRVWSYEHPTKQFSEIAGYLCFYASPFECFVDGEKVEAQPGDFYGGWKTSDVIGPIKGGPGTWGW